MTIANVGVKAHHLEGEELAQFIEDTAVAAPGYYPHCRHRHEIKQRSRDVARSAEKYWRAYPSRPRRSFTYQEMVERLEKRSHKPNLNEVKRDRASQRITDTVAHLSETLQALPRTVKTLMKLIRETSKQLFGISVSDKTLKKESNLPLWHPRFLKQQEGNPYATTAAAQEERTEPAQTVCSKKLTEQVMQQESVSELPVVAPPSPPEPHRVPEPVVPQEVLQADPLPTRHQESGATPSCVVRKNDPVSESPETNTSNGCNNRGYTLSLMKGIMCFRVAEMLFQLFQRAYCTAVMDTPGLDLVYQNGEGRTVNGLVYGVKLRKLP
ncbi:hypothetical protein [Hyella patelloides]|uniref:hypothetical protein n=1 Tax=Hyella patelloides TaxID=1982969 RepID=UPI0011A84F47|nr:hypothetical protein [Hyella patelloides]